MIDISEEKLVTPAEITKHVPCRRAGKKCNIATVYRWMTDGVRSVKLESLCVGGTRCTSIEALQRFFDALTTQADSQHAPPPRRKQIEAAERRLQKAGV